MNLLLFSFFLLLLGPGTYQGLRAQSTSQSETDDGTHYSYVLKSDAVDRFDLVQAFARASGVPVNPGFSGDWTTSDDDGIEYSLNTRRHFLAIRYHGDDPAAAALARDKAQAIRVDLDLPQDAPEPPPPGGEK